MQPIRPPGRGWRSANWRSRGVRPMPADFRETFIRVGWTGIERAMRAHKKTIVRWIEQCGREELTVARAAYVKANGVGRGTRDYIIGRRSAVTRCRDREE